MFKFLDKYFIKEFFYIFFYIFCFLFPLIFLADYIFSGQFIFTIACSKILYRYGELMNIILLLSSYLTVKNLIHRHSLVTFINLGCSKFVGLKALFFINIIISFFYYFIIISSNDYMFNAPTHSAKWFIFENKDKNTIFVHKKKDNAYEIYIYNEKEEKIILKRNNVKNFNDNLYCIVWNDPKKMSFTSLNEYKKYLINAKLDYSEVDKQKMIFFSKFFLFFVMLLCGYALAFVDSLYLLFLSLFFSNWLDVLAFFLNLKYCIILLCTNLIFFIFLSFYLLI